MTWKLVVGLEVVVALLLLALPFLVVLFEETLDLAAVEVGMQRAQDLVAVEHDDSLDVVERHVDEYAQPVLDVREQDLGKAVGGVVAVLAEQGEALDLNGVVRVHLAVLELAVGGRLRQLDAQLLLLELGIVGHVLNA